MFLLKHYKNSVFSTFLCFLFKEEKNPKRMTTGISGLVIVQKWPFRDGCLFFKKCFDETPSFKVFVGCARFLVQVVKNGEIRETLDPPK